MINYINVDELATLLRVVGECILIYYLTIILLTINNFPRLFI